MAAKRMTQHRAKTINLITLIANGSLAFLDFFAFAIMEWKKGKLKMQHTPIQRQCSKSIKGVIRLF
ncbi:MAG: hypothetical protein IM598_07485 [Chitinophagaceae bacterium]|nr:hypothetical protein [Chitinophagaceae bacterium]MCA6459282.1 hypothetical protein [Chitinophagaceae bacterium]MCA6464652.1 hypothetical protein [Chitinophagaceae bacterium]